MASYIQQLEQADAQARNAAYMAPYAALAAHIASGLATVKQVSGAVKEARTGIWNEFKSAFAIAQENGHNAKAFTLGMALACETAGIKPGTYRSYVATCGSIWEEIHDGKVPHGENQLTIAEVPALTIAAARKRYRVLTNTEKLHASITEALKEADEETLAAVLSFIRGDAVSQEDESEDEQDEARTGTDG